MNIMRTLSLILSVFVVCVSSSQYAGMKTSISRQAIKHFSDKIVPTFVKHFKPIFVPQVFNRFYVEISKIKISKMDLPSDSFDGWFEGNDVIIYSDDVSVSISMQLNVDLPFYSYPYQMNVSCEHSRLEGRFGFSYHNGYPLFNIKSLNVTLNNIDIKLNGTLMYYVSSTMSYLLNTWVMSRVQQFLSDTLKDKIVDVSNEKFIHMFDNTTLYNQSYSVSLDLVDSAILADEYICLNLDGTSYHTHRGRKELPVAKGIELPEFDSNSSGYLQLFVSEYTFNTLLYTAWEAESFNLNISTQKPKSDSWAMKLAWVRDYISKVTDLFGGSSINVLVEMACTEPPKITFKEDKINFKANFNFKVFATYQESKVRVYQAESPYDADYEFHETNMTLDLTNPKIRQANFNLSMLNSLSTAASQFDIVKLQDIADNMMKTMLEKMHFATTIAAVPSLVDMDLTTVSFSVHDGYMQFNMNPELIQYVDPELVALNCREEVDYAPEEIQYFTFEDEAFLPSA